VRGNSGLWRSAHLCCLWLCSWLERCVATRRLEGVLGCVVPISRWVLTSSHVRACTHRRRYRATVTKAQVRRGHCVLVTGIGGGVALFCLQFALALGATVWVTSSCPKKVAQAVSMGAAGGVLYTSADCKEQLKRLVPSGFDSVVDGAWWLFGVPFVSASCMCCMCTRLNTRCVSGAGGDAMNMYVSVLKIGGRISQYGATAGRPRSLHVTRMFLKNIELRGTSMGSPREFQAMLQLVTEARIVPVVSEIHPMEETLRAFDSLQRSSQFGKVVIRVSTGSSDDSMARPTPSSKL